MKTKVRVGSKYKYEPEGLDLLMPTNKVRTLNKGDIVKVVNLPGAPKANTMGHCYISDLDGNFIGLVATYSLKKIEK